MLIKKRSYHASWDGMSNLLNTSLVVNALLLGIDASMIGVVKKKNEMDEWTYRTNMLPWFWNSFAFALCSHAVSCVFAAGALSLLSFVEADDTAKVSEYYHSFKYCLVALAYISVLNFWLAGIVIARAIAFVAEEVRYDTIYLWFQTWSAAAFGLLFYILYVQWRLDKIDTNKAPQPSDIASALDNVDASFASKYLSAFQEAGIEVEQLPQLSASQIAQHLAIPFGPALKMADYFATIDGQYSPEEETVKKERKSTDLGVPLMSSLYTDAIYDGK